MKKKIFTLIMFFIFPLLLLSMASCSFFEESPDGGSFSSSCVPSPPKSMENNPNVIEYGNVGEALSLNVSFNEFITRSAVPSTLGTFLSDPELSMEALIEDTATGYVAEGLAGIFEEASEKKIRLVFYGFVSPVSKSYAITIKIKKSGYAKSLMEGKLNVSVPAYSRLMNAQEKLVLYPGQENGTAGSVSLKLVFGTEYSAAIDSTSISNGFSIANSTSAEGKACTLTASGIPAGTYEVTFTLLSGTVVSFRWTESIVVYANLQTDLWVSTGTNQKNISNAGQIEFYVRGRNSNAELWNAYESADGSDSTGTGSRKRPYATLQKAVDSIIVLNTINSDTYTIYCDGTFGINEGATGGSVLKISTEDSYPLKLNIEPMTADGIILDGDGSNLTVFYMEKMVTLNARKMTVQKGVANGVKGGGIYAGYGCSIYLTDCIVKNCTAEFGGGIYIAGSLTATSELEITNTKILKNSARDSGGGIYIGEDALVGLYGSDSLIAFNEATGIASSSCGGGVFAKGKESGENHGIFAIYDGYVTGNKSCYGGGIFLGGSEVANEGGGSSSYGGAISGNIASDSFGGGGVGLNKNSSIGFYGGTIGGEVPADPTVPLVESNLETLKQMGNYSYGNGGGLSLSEGSIINLNIGLIKNNKSNSSGSGIYSEGSVGLYENSQVHASNDIYLANAFTADNKNYGLTLNGALSENILVSFSKTYEDIVENSYCVAHCLSPEYAEANESKIKIKSVSADDNDGHNQSYKYCMAADGNNLVMKRTGVAVIPTLPGEYIFVLNNSILPTGTTGSLSFKVTDNASSGPNELIPKATSIAICQNGIEFYRVTKEKTVADPSPYAELDSDKINALPPGSYEICMRAIFDDMIADGVQIFVRSE